MSYAEIYGLVAPLVVFIVCGLGGLWLARRS